MASRPHSDLTDHELALAWMTAFKVMAQDVRNEHARMLVTAFGDEMSARGQAPPLEQVVEDVQAIREQTLALEAPITLRAMEPSPQGDGAGAAAVQAAGQIEASDRTHAGLSDAELAEAWVEAFKLMAADFKDRERRNAVNAWAQEIRVRGFMPPLHRVANEMAAIAAQIRNSEAQQSPAPMQRIRQDLEDDLTAFVAERNAFDRARRNA